MTRKLRKSARASRFARAQHSAATTRLELVRAERNDARRNALNEAVAPLLEIARTLRTTAERDALAVYVLRKIADSR